jgi:hypothetical protein
MITGWQIASVTMSEYDVDGFLGLQYDAEGEQASGVPPFETHSIGGILHRPLDPVVDPQSGAVDASQSANVLVGWQGGQAHAFALEDPRVVPLLPTAKPGETIVYGAAGQFTRYHADGSITHMTSDAGGAASGQSLFWKLEPTQFLRIAPWGTETWNQSVYRLKTAAGASLTLGAIGGLPAPLDAVSSYVRIEASMIELSAQMVTIGAAGGVNASSPPSNACKTDPLLVVLGNLTTSLQAVALALASASPTSGITPAQTAAVTAAVASLTAAVVAAPALLKSSLLVG